MKKSFVLGAAVVAAALAAAHYGVRMDRYAGFSGRVFVDIPMGTSSAKIGRMLAEAGVLRHRLLFPLARLARPWAKPLAGEYEFSAAATPGEVFARLARGDVYLLEVMVPEGSNVFDIARIVEHAGLGPAEQFVRLTLKQEGFLFPATYRFRRKTSLASVAETMRAQFDKTWGTLNAAGASRHDVVTLASLVEKEAVRAEERPRIAGVYRNRLAKGMKLDCDPTVAYAAELDGRWSGVILKTDLASANRYNTYQHAGLPPGPVANPGLASLKAALAPLETDELYFVVKPDHSGAHVFSASYEAHQHAVAEYRRAERNHIAAPAPAPGGDARVARKPADRAR